MDGRFFIFIKKTDTLFRGISPLIELSRQVLDGKDAAPYGLRERLLVEIIHRRFREDCFLRDLIGLVREVLCVITDKYPDILDSLDVHIVLCLVEQLLCLDRVGRLLFNVYSSYHCSPPKAKF